MKPNHATAFCVLRRISGFSPKYLASSTPDRRSHVLVRQRAIPNRRLTFSLQNSRFHSRRPELFLSMFYNRALLGKFFYGLGPERHVTYAPGVQRSRKRAFEITLRRVSRLQIRFHQVR